MIPKTETITWNGPRVAVAAMKTPASDGNIFKMKPDQSGRMAGSMPVWGPAETPAEKIVGTLASATKTGKAPPDFATALSAIEQTPQPDDQFGFADLVDMVNPLQHIPLVSTVYRNVTGDEIKPISRILGGAVFGGAVGAAAGIVNTVVEAETGKDIADNMVAFVRPDKTKPNQAPAAAIMLAQTSGSVTGLSAGDAADEARFAAILNGVTAARRTPSISAKTDVALTLFAQNQPALQPAPAMAAAAYKAPRYNS